MTHDRVDEEIVGAGHVEQLLGKTALGRGRFEVVLVLGEIFGHGDKFASDVVPGIENDFRFRIGGFDGRVLLRRVLGIGGDCKGYGKQGGSEKRRFAHRFFLQEVSCGGHCTWTAPEKKGEHSDARSASTGQSEQSRPIPQA